MNVTRRTLFLGETLQIGLFEVRNVSGRTRDLAMFNLAIDSIAFEA
jgi:hypothetical protein